MLTIMELDADCLDRMMIMIMIIIINYYNYDRKIPSDDPTLRTRIV